MMTQGYSLNFKGEFYIVFDVDGYEITRVKLIDYSFPLNFNMATQHVYGAKIGETWLWHKRFRHYYQKSLPFMEENECW